jgi:hypothetical protein
MPQHCVHLGGFDARINIANQPILSIKASFIAVHLPLQVNHIVLFKEGWHVLMQFLLFEA